MKLAKVAFLVLSMMCLVPANAEETGRTYLGIWGLPNKDDSAAGVSVLRVAPDSPAKKAEIKEGDRILAVNDEAVKDYDQLRTLISQRKAGDEITLKILRDGQEQLFTVKLEEAPAAESAPAFPFDPARPFEGEVWRSLPEEVRKQAEEARRRALEEMRPRPMIGVQLHDLSDALRERLKLGADVKGVVVADVLADGPAVKAGVEEEDVITAADGQAIAMPADLQKIVAGKKEGETIKLQIHRRGEAVEKSVIVAMSQPGNEIRAYLVPGTPMFGSPDFQRHFAEWESRSSERIKELEAQVEKLQERIRVLEEKISGGAPTGEPTLP